MIVHQSEKGQINIVPFKNLKTVSCQIRLGLPLVSHMVANQLVRFLFICNSTEIENNLSCPEETHKLPFHSYTVTFNLAKTGTKVATLTHTCTLIVAIWLFILAAHWGDVRKAT